MKTRKTINLLLWSLFISIMFIPGNSWAFDIVARIEGASQGWIQGTSTVKGEEKGIILNGFGHNLLRYVDPATFQITGSNIVTQPFKVLKDFDKSSPGLMMVMTTGEMLTTVSIRIYDTDTQGALVKRYTIELTNARISAITSTGSASSGGGLQELVGFIFESMLFRDEVNNIETIFSPGAPPP